MCFDKKNSKEYKRYSVIADDTDHRRANWSCDTLRPPRKLGGQNKTKRSAIFFLSTSCSGYFVDGSMKLLLCFLLFASYSLVLSAYGAITVTLNLVCHLEKTCLRWDSNPGLPDHVLNHLTTKTAELWDLWAWPHQQHLYRL